MQSITFKGLGTQWTISIDHPHIATDLESAILSATKEFESRFSRFLADSEVNAFREAKAGTYAITPEFATLLARADELRTFTNGRFDPALAPLLEGAGYNKQYALRPNEAEIAAFTLPKWSLKRDDQTLLLDGPTAFDLGGIGKGYWIDRVASIVKEHGHEYYIVEGGGDMVATTKEDGSGWRVAIEMPGEPDTALGVVELNGQGFAASDTFKRRWGKWHHVIDPITKEPVMRILGCAVVADDAWNADSMTSALFLAEPKRYTELCRHYRAEYLVTLSDKTVHASAGWAGEVF